MKLHPVILDIETTGLDPFTDRIVAIGVKRGRDVRIFTDEEESKILRDFYDYILDEKDPLRTQVLVGYNIQNFDIPFITARTLKWGYLVEAGLLRRIYRADLMTIVTRYLNTKNRNLSLRAVAEFFDIEINDDISGADVPRLWEERNFGPIIQHCLSDLSVTGQIFERLRYLVEHNIERRYELDEIVLEVDAP